MTVNINNETRILGVIGSPVRHSLSPVIHNFMTGGLGLNYVYLPFEVRPGAHKNFLEAAKALNIAGFNVTMPHKEALASLMDKLSDDAHSLQAVNTVCLKDGEFHGHNTDGEGFMRALSDMDIEIRGKNVMILGAGGAAKAVSAKLYNSGASKITVLNRDIKKAECLRYGREDRIFTDIFDTANIKKHIKNCKALINCTPLGMHGVNSDFGDMSFLKSAPEGMAVCDLIYRPEETELLKYARELGLNAQNGLGMLIHQAILALEIFTGVKIDACEMKKKLEKLLSGQ